MFTDETLTEAAKYPTLGPAYFEARAVVERQMAKFEAEQFEPLIKEFADKFRERLWSDVKDHMLSDAELNMQGEMYRMVDASVMAILSGEQWAIERYALHKYDGEKVRAAVAKHIPKELQDARIADLEKEVARLRESLKFHQRSY
jgi:hypothetical protein